MEDSFPVKIFEDSINDAHGSLALPSDEPNPYGFLDVRGLAVADENEANLTLDLEVGHFTMAEHLRPGHWVNAVYDVNFTLVDTPFRYNLHVAVLYETYVEERAWVAAAYGPTAALCVSKGGAGCEFRSLDEDVTLDASKGIIRVALSKASLAGIDSRGGAIADVPARAGSTLALWHVDARGNQPLGDHWARDSAPDTATAATYQLRKNPPSTVVLIRINDGNRTVPVLSGQTIPIRFTVANLWLSKQVIDLNYSIQASGAHTYVVQGPKSISLPARQWRNYTMTLTATADEPLPDSSGGRPFLAVHGHGQGSGDVGYARADIVAAFALTPTQNRLYFHMERPRADSMCPDPGCANTAFLTPKPPEETSADYWRCVANQGVATRTIQGAPFALDVRKPAKLQLHLALRRMDQESVSVTVEVVQSRRPLIASGTDEFAVTTAGGAVSLDARIKYPSPYVVLAPGPQLAINLAMEFPADPVDTATMNNICWRARGSFLELPVVELPEAYQFRPEPSPFQVALESEREEFVNPGKARLFNFTITNIDALEQRLRLDATTTSPGWTTRFVPGGAFDLPAAESVRIGLVVQSPASAGEGERTNVTLRALADDASIRTETVFLTATTGTPLPDEADSFEVAEEDLQKLVEDAPRTPAATWLLVALALGGVVAQRRRRAR